MPLHIFLNTINGLRRLALRLKEALLVMGCCMQMLRPLFFCADLWGEYGDGGAAGLRAEQEIANTAGAERKRAFSVLKNSAKRAAI